MTVRIITGDCRDVLATLPAESVHCVVTSPPYFRQRDYGIAGQLGQESTPAELADALAQVAVGLWRVLRPDGSFWFNAGTTGLVADRLQRDCIGIELNPVYADMARKRIVGDAPLFVAAE
jgi:DNA modification methylase